MIKQITKFCFAFTLGGLLFWVYMSALEKFGLGVATGVGLSFMLVLIVIVTEGEDSE